jgi:hypothetical protein
VGYHAIKCYVYTISQTLSLGFPYRFALRPLAIPPFANASCEFVHFFDYIGWDSLRNIETLENEVNWRHPVGQDSRRDSRPHCLGNYSYLKLCGISCDEIIWGNFIRENVEIAGRHGSCATSTVRADDGAVHAVGIIFVFSLPSHRGVCARRHEADCFILGQSVELGILYNNTKPVASL